MDKPFLCYFLLKKAREHITRTTILIYDSYDLRVFGFQNRIRLDRRTVCGITLHYKIYIAS